MTDNRYLGCPGRVMLRHKSGLFGLLVLQHQGFESGKLAIRRGGDDQDLI